jgi:hypothetical protein
MEKGRPLMISLFPYKFDINECDQHIQELKHFLTSNLEIRETGKNGLQRFFSDRLNLHSGQDARTTRVFLQINNWVNIFLLDCAVVCIFLAQNFNF